MHETLGLPIGRVRGSISRCAIVLCCVVFECAVNEVRLNIRHSW